MFSRECCVQTGFLGVIFFALELLFLGSPRQYLEHYVFPVLLPAMEEMLKQAKEEKCFEVSSR